MFGAVFFIALTATAFNILGITMNEIYLLADDRASIPKETANCFCVMFCIITIWFSSLILHLGITLLPGNPTFIKVKKINEPFKNSLFFLLLPNFTILLYPAKQ